ncbi:MAG TPA: hypothetical protein DCZ02_01720 [Ruminococcaceae bacterium]|nr:hypothetical protein [Oscillospiraceae bacterium]
MKKTFTKKALSIFLAVIMSVTGLLPASVAFAEDSGVVGDVILEMFYSDTDTIVPKYQDDGVTEHIEYMYEGDELQLKYKLIDSVFPDNGYVEWYSDAPALADVDQTGKIKAFDSSKGAVIHLWIDNEVKTIPIIGSTLGKLIEKAFFNEYVDLDSMDTDEIVALLEKAFGSDSWISGQIDGYKAQLIDSLRTYLDKVNSDIHCKLYDAEGNLKGEDTIHVVVKKNEEWYAAFLPNGTHITNKSQIPTTQATGSQVQLYAITTPQRLNFGTVYSIKSSSIFSQGKVVATVDDSGLVKFKNEGKVTVMVSPDSDDVIQGILKFVNYFYKLQNTGTIDSGKVADILIKYIGIDINRNVLATILDACFAIKDIAGDVADPVQLTATAVKLIANLCLQFAYNDTIDFTVVKSQPLEAFDITGLTTVKEGQQIQLQPTNIVPSTGDLSDIVWRSSDPNIACVDSETGIVTGLDAGGSLGALSSQTCTIYALSTTNNVERSVTMTVTGKTGKYISKSEINGKDIVGIEETENFTYTVYPKRVADSENLYVRWGILTGYDEDDNPTYIWADSENDAVDPDGAGKIAANGLFTPLNGGVTTIALETKTGYTLSDGTFFEISSYTATKKVETGVPVEKIEINVDKALGNLSPTLTNKTVTINGVDYDYSTVKIGVGNAYYNHGAQISAKVYPENATYKDIKWVMDNTNTYSAGDYEFGTLTSSHTIDVLQKANNEHTDTFNIYAVSSDGEIMSNVVNVCVTRNYVTSNVINQDNIDMINGSTAEATHTLTFDGTWTSDAYACYGANWYSSDEDIFTVENKGNSNHDAVLTAHDVGTATLYCVSADGAYVDSTEVTVRADKSYLEELVDVCENTVVLRTKFNYDYFNDYMKNLDFAYVVLYEVEMASQNVVDTTAAELLASFIKVGGFVGVTSVQILGTKNQALNSNYVTVKVGSTKNYKNYSYDFDYQVNPKTAMYSKPVWKSSNDSIKVDDNGVCTPTSNDACSADITCTITDYNGTEVSDTKHIAFARTPAEGVELNKTEIKDAIIGTTEKLEAKVLPKNVFGNSTASVGKVTWYSSNENVATVDENGEIKYVYGGTAIITCTTADGGYTADCVVTVSTNYNKLTLLVNQYNDFELNEISYYPDTWAPYIEAKTEAEKMVNEQSGYTQEEVDAQYVKLETAYKNLKKFVDIQKVELYLDGEPTSEFYQYDLKLLKEGLFYTNAKLNLKVRLYPNNASYESVVWESSTPDISVSTEGVCSPTQKRKPCYGRITCTVTDAFGKQFSDDVWVSFSYTNVTEIKLDNYNIVGNIGDTQQIKATVMPNGTDLAHIGAADIQDYFWESDNENVATVDKSGNVTITGAGTTVVRCVSYDGGIYAECRVSGEGDRHALEDAINEYKDIDYKEYEYQYGIEFKNAYEDALVVLEDKTKTQTEIDNATERLITAYEALGEHPFVQVREIMVDYKTYQMKNVTSPKMVESGLINSSDALSVNISNTSNYASLNNYNYVLLNANAAPYNAMYKSVTWEVKDTDNMNCEATGTQGEYKFTPSKNSRAYAHVVAVATDNYDRRTERHIYIVISDDTCSALNVDETELNLLGTQSAQLHYSTSGSGDYYQNVLFSTTDSNVAVVNESGYVSAVNAGECEIVVKTLDGGITKKVKVTVQTDYSVLEQKVNEYQKLIDDTKDTNQYTEESLAALGKQVEKCRDIVNSKTATQTEVNDALAKLNEAYANLRGYIPATGIKLYLNDGQSAVTTVNEGFVRYVGNSLNGVTVQLGYSVEPAGGMFSSIEYTSSNTNITVDENGLVTNNTLLPGATLITATITTSYGDTYSSSIYLSFVRYAVVEVAFTSDVLYGAPTETKAVPVELKAESRLGVNPSVKDCIYESSDETIATVDGEGMVSFRKQGSAVITVTSIDGGLKGQITVYTTWDTTALQEVIAQAEKLTYTDYEYDYGMMLNTDLENAKKVYEDYTASQEQIDSACAKLQETLNILDEHKFVLPAVTLTVGDEIVKDNESIEAANGALNVKATFTGMYKSYQLSCENENNLTSSVNGDTFTLTKGDGVASVTLKVAITDTYDRVTETTYTINLVDELVCATSVDITLDGKVVEEVTKSGYSRLYRDFEAFSLGYILNPEGASAPSKVEWSSTNSSKITIDENGLVDLTTTAKLLDSNDTYIICKVTNSDGTTVTKQIHLVICR